MEFNNAIPSSEQPKSLTHNTVYKVDFTFRKFKGYITEHDSLESMPEKLDVTSTPPAFMVYFNTLKSPSIVFKRGTSDVEIGSGTLKAFSINPNFEVHGRKSQFKAQRRMHIEYQHLSHAFSSTADPVTMDWKSECGFRDWDFVCTDPQGNPVAKFSSGMWKVRKIGFIEFVGPKALDVQAREEIIVTGLTLYYTVLCRASSIFQFFGGVFSRPGPIKQGQRSVGGEQDVDEDTLMGEEDRAFQKDGLVLEHKEVDLK